jgi:hypothetical protein
MSSITSGVKMKLRPRRLLLRADFFVAGAGLGALFRSLAISELLLP